MTTELLEEYQTQTGQKPRLIKQVSTTDNGILTVDYYTDGFVEWLAELIKQLRAK